MHTALLRQQHVELGNAIAAILQAAKDKKPGLEIRGLLVSLSGKLTMHLSAEDRILYPGLQQAKDPAAAALGRRFAEEMGGLAAAFKAFSQTYSSGTVIEADRAAFSKAFQGVVDAVVKRVKAEEDILYPVADRTATA